MISRFVNSSGPLKLTLAATVAIFLTAIGVCKLSEMLFGLPEQNQVRLVRDIVGWNWRFALTCVWVVVATPVIEESLFRFLLFRMPARLFGGGDSWWRLTPFALVSSVLFSAAHYIDFQRLFRGGGFALTSVSNAVIALVFVGFSWCWLYRKTGRLRYTMLSHGIFNLINLALVVLMVVMGWDK